MMSTLEHDEDRLDRLWLARGEGRADATALHGLSPAEILASTEEGAAGDAEAEERLLRREVAVRLLAEIFLDGAAPAAVHRRALNLAFVLAPHVLGACGVGSFQKMGEAMGLPRRSARATAHASFKRDVSDKVLKHEGRNGHSSGFKLPGSKSVVACEKVAAKMRGRRNRCGGGRKAERAARLSALELQVLDLADAGLTEAEIVVRLNLKQSAVRTALRRR